MDRTLAGSSRPRTAARTRGRHGYLPDGVREGLLELPRHARRALRAAWASRRGRIALIATLCALPLLGGVWLLLRHSRLVAVEHVTVRGVHGPQAAGIERALRAAARGMSTLDAKPGPLMAAVRSYPAVAAVRLKPDFPHGLRIDVVEQPPVAALLVNGVRTAVSAGGVALGPALLSSSLPTINGWYEPPPGRRLRSTSLREVLTVIGDAPAQLSKYIAKAYDGGQRGLTLVMTNGLFAYFGDARRAHAKWASLVRVLADPSSAGASYLDVRVPGHPAAGFPGGVAPDLPEGASGAEVSAGGQSAISALAATLSAGTGEELAGAKATEEAHEEGEGSASGEGEEAEASTPSGEGGESEETGESG